MLNSISEYISVLSVTVLDQYGSSAAAFKIWKDGRFKHIHLIQLFLPNTNSLLCPSDLFITFISYHNPTEFVIQ